MPITPSSTPPADSVSTPTIQDDAVVEAKLADNAVTNDKLAGGTAGEVRSYDASGDPADAPAGTAGQVFTSNGAGAAPTMQDAAGGGGIDPEWAEASAADLISASLGSQGIGGGPQVVIYNDAASQVASFSVKVPAGATSISSVEVIYENNVSSVLVVRLQLFPTALIDRSAFPHSAIEDFGTAEDLAGSSTTGQWNSLTLASQGYDGIGTIAAGDIITFGLRRVGSAAEDTWGTDFRVAGLLVIFA